MCNKSPGVHVLVSNNSEVKTCRENIVRPFSLSKVSPFYVRKTRNNIFFVFSAEIWFNTFVHQKNLILGKLIGKCGNFSWQRLPHETTVFSRQSNKCIHSNPTGAAVAHFLWPVFSTFGRIVLHLTNGNLGWARNRPPIAQVVAEDITEKNAKPQIDWHWLKTWLTVPSVSKIGNPRSPQRR